MKSYIKSFLILILMISSVVLLNSCSTSGRFVVDNEYPVSIKSKIKINEAFLVSKINSKEFAHLDYLNDDWVVQSYGEGASPISKKTFRADEDEYPIFFSYDSDGIIIISVLEEDDDIQLISRTSTLEGNSATDKKIIQEVSVDDIDDDLSKIIVKLSPDSSKIVIGYLQGSDDAPGFVASIVLDKKANVLMKSTMYIGFNNRGEGSGYFRKVGAAKSSGKYLELGDDSGDEVGFLVDVLVDDLGAVFVVTALQGDVPNQILVSKFDSKDSENLRVFLPEEYDNDELEIAHVMAIMNEKSVIFVAATSNDDDDLGNLSIASFDFFNNKVISNTKEKVTERIEDIVDDLEYYIVQNIFEGINQSKIVVLQQNYSTSSTDKHGYTTELFHSEDPLVLFYDKDYKLIKSIFFEDYELMHYPNKLGTLYSPENLSNRKDENFGVFGNVSGDVLTLLLMTSENDEGFEGLIRKDINLKNYNVGKDKPILSIDGNYLFPYAFLTDMLWMNPSTVILPIAEGGTFDRVLDCYITRLELKSKWD